MAEAIRIPSFVRESRIDCPAGFGALLQSILSVIQMPEAGSHVIYGIVIIAMLLYGRERAEQ